MAKRPSYDHERGAQGEYGSRRMNRAEPRIAATLASTYSDRQQGGLTAVVRELAAASSERFAWSWLTRLDRDGSGATDMTMQGPEGRRAGTAYEVRTVAPAVRSRHVLRGVEQLRFRPGGDRLAPAAYGRLVRASVARQVPADARFVHWVGTGSELLGFELRRLAGSRGLPFTVCPALHAHEWGDGTIDGSLYRKADAVLAFSEHERERLAELGVPLERSVKVPLGPTVAGGGDGARFRAKHGLPDVPLVVFLGRRTRSKGLQALLEAFALLRAAQTPCALAVSGPAGDVTGAPAGVLDLGVCDEAEKADLLAAADMLCVPSVSESFGIVYVDAWAAGLPVISSHPAPVVELVEDGVDGLRVDQEPGAIAAAVRALVEDADLARRLGAAGHRKQQSTFTWERCAAAHERTFHSLLETA